MKQHVVDPSDTPDSWAAEEIFGHGFQEDAVPVAESASTGRTPPLAQNPSSRGLMVEVVRLIVVAIFAVGGWEIGAALSKADSQSHLVGILLGISLGYVLGGMFGRQTASAVTSLEREFARVPASEILSGAIGLIFGLVLVTLLALPLYHLPPAAAYHSVAFRYLTVGYPSYNLGPN